MVGAELYTRFYLIKKIVMLLEDFLSFDGEEGNNIKD